MSRIGHFRRGVSTAYLLLAANMLYSLASVPLGLGFLSKDEFGLWAIVIQLGGYLQLVEMGMASAFSRLVIDFQGKESDDEYGKLCSSAVAALVVQATLMVLAGVGVALLLAPSLGIDEGLRSEFTLLMILQSGVIGCIYATRIFSLLLFANHRIAITNVVQIVYLAVSLGSLGLALQFGAGVYSLIYGSLIGLACSLPISIVMTFRLGLLPKSWHMPDLASLKNIFTFGRDIFLIHVGTMLISASQVVIVTKSLGLDAAAVWSVCVRPFLLVSRFCWRPIDLAYTFFSEMYVRGENGRLRDRYHSLLGITLLTVAVAAVGIGACNGPFVEVWTRGRISWQPLNDVLLGLWLIGLTVARFGSYTIQATKEIHALKYIYLVEGMIFILLGLWLTPFGGIAVMLVLSILLTAVFTGYYCSWRISRLFGEPLGANLRIWLLPAFKMLGMLGPAAWLVSTATADLSAVVRLVANGLTVTAGSLLFARFAVDGELKKEILSRVPKRAATLLGHLWGQPRVA